ncbi:hypothetical protein TSUD_342710 [Trifolium subterraneum]|nr:hypothetical protein TSUD_342710 [Trifolium subterraneum]
MQDSLEVELPTSLIENLSSQPNYFLQWQPNLNLRLKHKIYLKYIQHSLEIFKMVHDAVKPVIWRLHVNWGIRSLKWDFNGIYCR